MNRTRGIAWGAVALSCLAVVLFPPTRAAADDVYKWVDDQGNSHFADSPDKVPAQYQEESEHREMDTPAAAAAEDGDRPSYRAPMPAGDGQGYDAALRRHRKRERACRRKPGADIRGCFKACVDPHDRRARKVCEQGLQQRRQADKAARTTLENDRRVEERTRCRQTARTKKGKSRCLDYYRPPRKVKVKVVEP